MEIIKKSGPGSFCDVMGQLRSTLNQYSLMYQSFSVVDAFSLLVVGNITPAGLPNVSYVLLLLSTPLSAESPSGRLPTLSYGTKTCRTRCMTS